MIDEVEVQQLKDAIEVQHVCTATFVQPIPITETFGGKTVWKGVVHVFDITGHPGATRAYAWSSPIGGSNKRRFFAVLHQPPVTSPVEAVRAAIVAEQNRRQVNTNDQRTFRDGYIDGWRAILGSRATVPGGPEYRQRGDASPYNIGRQQGVADALARKKEE